MAATPSHARTTCETVTITLRGRAYTLSPEAGETIVQTAYRCGLAPPVSCLAGACATCLARLTGGAVSMIANDALSADEIARGYVLTCQAVPMTDRVAVDYDDA